MFPQLQLTLSCEIWSPCPTPLSLLLSYRWSLNPTESLQPLSFLTSWKYLMLQAMPFPSMQVLSSASRRLCFLPVFFLSYRLSLLSVFGPSLQCWHCSSGRALGTFFPSTYSFCKITTPKALIITHMLMYPKSRIPIQVSGAILSCKSVYLIAYWLFPSGNFGGTSNSTLSN